MDDCTSSWHSRRNEVSSSAPPRCGDLSWPRHRVPRIEGLARGLSSSYSSARGVQLHRFATQDGISVKFIVIYGPSGIGKESVGRELARRNDWHLFPQHLAFDISCAVVGFGNNGFEKYQRKVCLDAFRALIEKKVLGIVFTFCYVSPASNYFVDGLFDLLKEFAIKAEFIRLSCDFDEHVRRVTSEGRKNTNKIQSKDCLEEYLRRFDFSVDIPCVESVHLDNTELSVQESALEIERRIVT
jgi:deoxyadenosine/deoxycytidine kinase